MLKRGSTKVVWMRTAASRQLSGALLVVTKYRRLPFGINLASEEFECKLHEKLDGLPGVAVIRDDILGVRLWRQ